MKILSVSNNGENPSSVSRELALSAADHNLIQDDLLDAAMDLRENGIPDETTDRMMGIAARGAHIGYVGGLGVGPQAADLVISSHRVLGDPFGMRDVLAEPRHVYGIGAFLFPHGRKQPLSIWAQDVAGDTAASQVMMGAYDEELRMSSMSNFAKLAFSLGELTSKAAIADLGHPRLDYTFREALHYLLAEIVSVAPDITRETVFTHQEVASQILPTDIFDYTKQGVSLRISERSLGRTSKIRLTSMATLDLLGARVAEQFRYTFTAGSAEPPTVKLDLISNHLSTNDLVNLAMTRNPEPGALISTAIELFDRTKRPSTNAA